MARRLVLAGLLCGLIGVGALGWRLHRGPSAVLTRSPVVWDPQQTVDDLVALQPVFPTDIVQLTQLILTGTTTNRFDVNRYFTVLRALRPETGYVLDWVYLRHGGAAWPVLYARPVTQAPFTNADAYAASLTNAATGNDQLDRLTNDFFVGYLDKVRAEDSPQGFCELVILRLLGDRFYLFWHELYRETMLVCSRQGWATLVAKERQREGSYRPPSDSFVAAADRLDFTPTVRMGTTQVEVRIMTYGPFEGLNQHDFTIARQYPHRLIAHAHTNLLERYQNFVF